MIKVHYRNTRHTEPGMQKLNEIIMHNALKINRL